LTALFCLQIESKSKTILCLRNGIDPYVEAFLETDGTKLAALIAEAERVIVGRFLELLVSSVETDEFVDLQSAAYALTQLKKACIFVDTPQHLVA
jgi:hypothetical protein